MPCNWLQHYENGLDWAHVSVVHAEQFPPLLAEASQADNSTFRCVAKEDRVEGHAVAKLSGMRMDFKVELFVPNVRAIPDPLLQTARPDGKVNNIAWTDLGLHKRERVVDGKVEIGAWMSSNLLGHEVACMRDNLGERGKLHHVAMYSGVPQHNIDAAEMFRDYDIQIEAGPDKHGITQGSFLYVFEPGGNRIELFGDAGFLHMDPDSETRTWHMSDIDTGLAIGGTKLPWETYFTYGTPSTLSLADHIVQYSHLTAPAPQEVDGALSSGAGASVR
jgi:hypothetical protein